MRQAHRKVNAAAVCYGFTRRKRANEKKKLEREWNAARDRFEAEKRKEETERAKVKLLARLLHKDPALRASAAFALSSHAAEPKVFRALMRASFDPDHEVRFEAMRSLVGSKDLRAWKRLFNMYHHAKKKNDADAYRYRLGVLLMECAEPGLFSRMEKLIKGKHFLDRAIATEYFAKIRTRESLGVVLDAIENEGNPNTKNKMMDVADSLLQTVFSQKKQD